MFSGIGLLDLGLALAVAGDQVMRLERDRLVEAA
jgi:hypothetical protein